MDSKTIGLIGLGRMGSAILERLTASHDVLIYDLNTDATSALVSERAVAADSLEDFRECQHIVLCLPSVTASTSVINRLNPVARNARLYETSTIPPEQVRSLAGALSNGNVLFDAAILAGVEAMRGGQAKLLVGNAKNIQNCDDTILRAFSVGYTPFDELGGGMAAKIINNAVAHANMSVLLEARAMAEAHGISNDELFSVLDDEDSGVYRPYEFRLKQRVVSEDFRGGMSVSMALKDSLHAIEVATGAGVPLFSIAGAHQVYQLAMAAGLGDLDYSSINLIWSSSGRGGSAANHGALAPSYDVGNPAPTKASR